MDDFLLLYRGGDRPQSPEQGEQIMQKWASWLADLEQKGHLKDRGQPLDPAGKVVAGKQKAVTDGPYTESKDLVGGFSLIQARDLAQAAEVSKDCPIFDRGGLVEVRPIMKM